MMTLTIIGTVFSLVLLGHLVLSIALVIIYETTGWSLFTVNWYEQR